jgi:hypothetical protein
VRDLHIDVKALSPLLSIYEDEKQRSLRLGDVIWAAKFNNIFPKFDNSTSGMTYSVFRPVFRAASTNWRIDDLTARNWQKGQCVCKFIFFLPNEWVSASNASSDHRRKY